MSRYSKSGPRDRRRVWHRSEDYGGASREELLALLDKAMGGNIESGDWSSSLGVSTN